MNAWTEISFAVILGGALALGIALTTARSARWAATSLSRRIAPYVRDVADPRGLTPVGATPGAMTLSERTGRALLRLGGAQQLSRRLAQAGSSLEMTHFRARQAAWAAGGVAVGAAVAVALALWGGGGASSATLAPLLGVAAAASTELRLTRAAHRRRARIEEELPTVLEFLSLCLAAGEGLRDAIRRVGEVGTGELTAEFRRVVLDSGTGSSLTDALNAVAQRLDVPSLGRAIDHIVSAIDRGAPLAEVLQDQAVDARDDAKRALIELAGRKEIAMLLPLVFLLLPLSVMFAVFPGVVMLRLGVG